MEAYEELLDEYREAIEQYESGNIGDSGLSETDYPNVADVINNRIWNNAMSSDWSYCYRDLNSDGVPELAIRPVDTISGYFACLYTYDASSGLIDLLDEYRENWVKSGGYFVYDNSSLVRIEGTIGSGRHRIETACRIESGALKFVESVEVQFDGDNNVNVIHTKTDGTTEKQTVSSSDAWPYKDDFDAAYPIDEDVTWTDL